MKFLSVRFLEVHSGTFELVHAKLREAPMII